MKPIRENREAGGWDYVLVAILLFILAALIFFGQEANGQTPQPPQSLVDLEQSLDAALAAGWVVAPDSLPTVIRFENGDGEGVDVFFNLVGGGVAFDGYAGAGSDRWINYKSMGTGWIRLKTKEQQHIEWVNNNKAIFDLFNTIQIIRAAVVN